MSILSREIRNLKYRKSNIQEKRALERGEKTFLGEEIVKDRRKSPI